MSEKVKLVSLRVAYAGGGRFVNSCSERHGVSNPAAFLYLVGGGDCGVGV